MNYNNEILSKWAKINRVKCPSCGSPISFYKIKNFDDPKGIFYEDFPYPQIVTFKCPKCNQRSSINKLLKKYPL